MKQLNTALLVDDDTINTFINERTIRKSGVCKEILSVHNGKEALKKVKEISKPDLILLDLNMPVMDGYDFLKEYSILNLEKGVVIVMLTTEINAEKEKTLRTYGAKGFITKPITEEKLLKLIEEHF